MYLSYGVERTLIIFDYYQFSYNLHLCVNFSVMKNNSVEAQAKITLRLVLAESRATYVLVIICTCVLIFSVIKNDSIEAQATRIFVNCVRILKNLQVQKHGQFEENFQVLHMV